MDTDYLSQSASLFGNWHIDRLIEEKENCKIYRVKRHLSENEIVYRQMLNFTFKTDAPVDESSPHPAKLRKFLSDTELMIKLRNCKNVVEYYDKRVVTGNNGFEVLILAQDVTPLCQKTDIYDLDKTEALKITYCMCLAAEQFRSLNITNRKICPENIFVDSSGNYRLGDFGLGEDYIPGNDYMSPEEYNMTGDIKGTDIYALGMLLYKLCNHNRAPFLPAHPMPINDENRENALKRRMNGEITGKFEASEPQEEALILKCCAFRVSDRYRNLASIKSDLEAIIRRYDPTYLTLSYSTGYSFKGAPVRAVKAQDAVQTDVININTENSGKIIPAYIDDDDSYSNEQETKKTVKGLIAAISIVAVLSAIFIAVAFFSNKNGNPGNITTQFSQTATLSETQTTAAPTAQSTMPTTESTTAETTTTEATTTEATTTEATTTEVTTTETTANPTDATTQPTTESTTDLSLDSASPTTTSEPTTLFNIPTETEYKDVGDYEIEFFEDEDRIDEILISVNQTFGRYVTGGGEVIIYTFDEAGSVVKTDTTQIDCYYDDNSDGITICDIILPSSLDIDIENYSYQIYFPKGIIDGYGFSNNDFSVDF